ncbi:MAG: hypothetical protein ACLQMF_08020 [Rectinemataceae bacterium]
MRFRFIYILAVAVAMLGFTSFAAFGMGGYGGGYGGNGHTPNDMQNTYMSNDTSGVSGAMPVPTWSGYLVDKTSGQAMKSGDVDLTTAPQDLTKAAEIANDGSGFGISILQGDTYKFFPFDDHGNQLASQLISATKRDMGLSVVVRGKIVDGILDVSSIVESNL